MRGARTSKDDVQSVGEVLRELWMIPLPTLGLDLDAPLDHAPIFFRVLLSHWPGRVIGFAHDRQQAMATIDRLNLRCDEVILAETAEAKGTAIYRSGVMAILSDNEEALRHVPPDRVRLKVM